MNNIKFKVLNLKNGDTKKFTAISLDRILKRLLKYGNENLVFMRYTGINYRGKQEFYEGDLIVGQNKRSQGCFEIVFHDGSFYYRRPTGKAVKRIFNSKAVHKKRFRVIGNIYELSNKNR